MPTALVRFVSKDKELSVIRFLRLEEGFRHSLGTHVSLGKKDSWLWDHSPSAIVTGNVSRAMASSHG